jgi:hypothetical protein
MPSSAGECRAVIMSNGGDVSTRSEVRFHCQIFTVIDQIEERGLSVFILLAMLWDLCWRGSRFESLTGHRLCCKVFVIFRSPSREMAG